MKKRSQRRPGKVGGRHLGHNAKDGVQEKNAAEAAKINTVSKVSYVQWRVSKKSPHRKGTRPENQRKSSADRRSEKWVRQRVGGVPKCCVGRSMGQRIVTRGGSIRGSNTTKKRCNDPAKCWNVIPTSASRVQLLEKTKTRDHNLGGPWIIDKTAVQEDHSRNNCDAHAGPTFV